MKPYEIKIRWNGEQFQGASMQEKEGDQFRFIPTTIWPALCAAINTDALATIDAQRLQYAALEAELVAELVAVKAEYAAFKSRATTVAERARAIIADPSISDADSCVQIDAMAADTLKNKIERDLAAADKVIAEAIAAREKLLSATLK